MRDFVDRSNKQAKGETHQCAKCWRMIDKKYTLCFGHWKQSIQESNIKGVSNNE